MERNTKTTMYHLAVGDRFYKCGDKNKTVYEKIDHEVKQTSFQTYSHWAIEAKYLVRIIAASNLEHFAKALKSDTDVIFLRNKND